MQHFGTLDFARDDMHACCGSVLHGAARGLSYLPMMAADMGPCEVEENRNQ